MTIIRVSKRDKNFLVLNTICLNEDDMTWAAKGLHSYLMSLPQNWRVRVNDLKNRGYNGRDAIRSLLKELEKFGYIHKESIRDESSGRFVGIEYVVYEIPQQQFFAQEGCKTVKEQNSKNSFTQLSSLDPPATEIPGTENPSPENPTLTNINSNNNTYKKTTANKTKKIELELQQPKNAAAVFSQKSKKTYQNHLKSAEDAVIGTELTSNQQAYIEAVVDKLNFDNSVQMVAEIKHSLLNPKNFTGCGQDFSRKFNAIKKVILRGDWQTPSDMVIESKNTEPRNSIVEELKNEIEKAHMDVNHFQRLLQFTKDQATQLCYKTTIQQAQIKIGLLHEKVQNYFSNNPMVANFN